MFERDTCCPGPQSLCNGTDFNLLPDQSPNTPTLRTNPYPKVTDPICQLPLPTLLYRPEAIHLGDLLQIWVRADATPFSPRRNSRASADYAEKTTLPRARVDVSGSFHVAVSVRGPIGSAIRLRNKDLIPFRLKLWSSRKKTPHNFIGFPRSLRID